jgi:predicted Zn-dependent peptidase
MNSDGVEKTVLANGIRVLTKKMPYLRSISMGVWVDIGARDENLAENGLCHFIEHMIFKGTNKRSGFTIAKEFDAIGGQTNAFTSMEKTCFYARIMDTHLETMVDILSDIFLNSVFENKEIENERPVILQEIGMAEDNPEEHAHFLLGKNFWGDSPLGRSILGRRDNVLNFDDTTIRNFFYQAYQPERIVIAASGNLNHENLLDLVGPAFESVAPVSNHRTPRRAPALCANISIRDKALEQVHVCIGTQGISITDERRFVFSLMNTILGGNMSSRLFQEIRERRGLAYSVYSFLSSFVDTGMFGIYAGVDPDQVSQTIQLVVKEMHRLKKKRVDLTELKNAKEFTKGNLMLSSESSDNQMVRLAQNEFNFGKSIPLETIVSKIDAVTPDDVIELAQDLFLPDQCALTLLGRVKGNPNDYKNILNG